MEELSDEEMLDLQPHAAKAAAARAPEPPPADANALIDEQVKEAMRVEVRNAKSFLAAKLEVLRDWAASFLGATIFPHVPTASLVLSIIALTLAYPLALGGLSHALFVVVPLALVAALLGLVSSQSTFSLIGMGLSVASVVLALASGIYLRHEEQVGKNELFQKEIEKAQEAGKKREAELKAAEEAKAKADAEAKAKADAEAAAKKAEDDKRNAEFLKQQQALADEKAAREKKKKEEELAAKQKAEDEVKRKQAAELARQANDIRKSEQIEATKATYREKTLKVEELTANLEKMQTALQVAKDQKEKKATFLERRNSPSPPSEDELTKAQKQYDEWKAEFDRLQKDIPAAQAELDKVAKEKKAASDLLDSLQKP